MPRLHPAPRRPPLGPARRRLGVLRALLLAAGLHAAGGCVVVPDVGYGLRTAWVVGATEEIHVSEANLDFLARIDTGASTTSLHAIDLRIEDPAPDMWDNIGKKIEFLSVNEAGRSSRVTAVIADVYAIRTTDGVEPRYIVPLHLRWRGVEREVWVNLRDRTPMGFKLLVGRDWLRGNFLVDVERNVREE